MLKKVTIIQCQIGQVLSLEDNLLIFKQHPDFIILPEYFNLNPVRRDIARNASEGYEWRKYCVELSDRLGTTLISGTSIESDDQSFYNTCRIYQRGKHIASYSKMNPTENERKQGITPGKQPIVIEIDGVRVSLLICADVLKPENFARLQPLRPDIVFIPTISPFRAQETPAEKFARDQDIFVAGARLCGAYIVKCCAVGSLWGTKLQGRSSICAPWGVITQIPPTEEHKKRILSVILDIDEIREFRVRQEQSC